MKTKFQKFLEDKAQPGRFDSSGEFKIAGHKALEKLAEHSVTDPAHWVLKVVQAGVSAQAREVRFVHFSTVNRADIVMEQLPSESMLLDSLLRLEHSENVFLRELCTGLRPLLVKDYVRIYWLQSGRQTGIQWDGQEFHSLAPKTNDSTETFLRIEFPLPLFNFSIRAEESTLLHRRCRWCPIPVKLDQKLVNSQANVRNSDFHRGDHGKDSPRHLAQGWFGCTGSDPTIELSNPVLAQVGRLADPLRTDSPFLYWPKPEKATTPSLGGFSLYCSYEITSTLIVDLLSNYGKRDIAQLRESLHLGATRYGVLCAELTHKEFGIGGEFVFPADEQKSDLTGLTLTITPAWCQQVQAKIQCLSKVLNTIDTEVSTHSSSLTVGDIAEKCGHFGLGLGIGTAAAVLGLVTGGVVLSLASPALPFYFLILSKRDEPEVLEALPEWVQEGLEKTRELSGVQDWTVTLGEFQEQN